MKKKRSEKQLKHVQFYIEDKCHIVFFNKFKFLRRNEEKKLLQTDMKYTFFNTSFEIYIIRF